MRNIIMRNTNSNFIYILTIFFFLLFLSQDVFAYKESELKKFLMKVNYGGIGTCKDCDLSNADLSGRNLYKANLSGANLSKANLSKAILNSANLSGANLSKANLSKANLNSANLSGANLSGTNLSGVDLSYQNLIGANLSKANLSKAILTGANLRGANLSGANLSGAGLNYAKLTDTQLDRKAISTSKFLSKKIKQDNYQKKKEELRKKKEKEQEELRKKKEEEKRKEELRMQNEKLSKQFDNVLRKIGPTTAFLPIGKEWGYLSCQIDHLANTLRKKPLYSKSPSLRKCVLERALKLEKIQTEGDTWSSGEFEGKKWYNLLAEFVYGKASALDKTNRHDKLEKLCGNCKEYTPKMILKSFCSLPAPRMCMDANETLRLFGIFEELDMHRQRCEGVKEVHYHNHCN